MPTGIRFFFGFLLFYSLVTFGAYPVWRLSRLAPIPSKIRSNVYSKFEQLQVFIMHQGVFIIHQGVFIMHQGLFIIHLETC